MSKIEIACFNPESAIIAFENGADRIELCNGLSEGGTTPDFETAKLLRENALVVEILPILMKNLHK